MLNPRLWEVIAKNDTSTFMSLVREHEEILEQKTVGSSSTLLHLASRFGNIEMAKVIVNLRPDLVAAENNKLETPMHEACREGNAEVLLLLLQTSPWVACKLNGENHTALFLACSNGHLNAVKLLLNQPWLLGLEEDGNGPISLHVAVSKGHTDIVEKILNVRPNLAQKVDKNGFFPMHYACATGQTEITKMFLSLNLDLAHFNKFGYTPLHLAIVNGKSAILEHFMSMDPASFQFLTEGGETVLHLAVKFNRYYALVYLVQVFNGTHLIDQPDRLGNTILHLAVLGGHYHLANYIIEETTLDISYQNNRGHTALNILNKAGSTSEIQHLKNILKKAEDKTTNGLPTPRPEIEEITPQPEIEEITPQPITLALANYIIEKTTLDISYQNNRGHTALNILTKAGSTSEIQHLNDVLKKAENKTSSGLPSRRPEIEEIAPQPIITLDSPTRILEEQFEKLLERGRSSIEPWGVPMSTSFSEEINSKADSLRTYIEGNIENPDNDPSKSESTSVKTRSSSNNLRRHKYMSHRHRKELRGLYQKGVNKQHETYREALQNARNTIILVAVLIATVTFTAGISPPGGVYQDGPLKGKSIMGRTTTFKVFLISNNIALFTSLSIVIILVSIIPFRRKPLMRLLMVVHKVMWVAVSFMATAYVAATWVITPHGQENSWVLEALISVCAGTLGSVFVFLGVMLVRHWLRKLKYRKEKKKRMQSASNIGSKNRTNSSNSDVSTQIILGYHLY